MERPQQFVELNEIDSNGNEEVQTAQIPVKEPLRWRTATAMRQEKEQRQELCIFIVLMIFAAVGFGFVLIFCGRSWLKGQAIPPLLALLTVFAMPLFAVLWIDIKAKEFPQTWAKVMRMFTLSFLPLVLPFVLISLFLSCSHSANDFLSQLNDEENYSKTICELDKQSCALRSPKTCPGDLNLYNSDLSFLNDTVCENSHNFTCFLKKSAPCTSDVRLTIGTYADKMEVAGSLEITLLGSVLYTILAIVSTMMISYNYLFGKKVIQCDEDPSMKFVITNEDQSILKTVLTRNQLMILSVIIAFCLVSGGVIGMVFSVTVATPSIANSDYRQSCELVNVLREDSVHCSGNYRQRTYLVSVPAFKNEEFLLADGDCESMFSDTPHTECFFNEDGSEIELNYPFPENIIGITANGTLVFGVLMFFLVIYFDSGEVKKEVEQDLQPQEISPSGTGTSHHSEVQSESDVVLR